MDELSSGRRTREIEAHGIFGGWEGLRVSLVARNRANLTNLVACDKGLAQLPERVRRGSIGNCQGGQEDPIG